MSENIQHVDMNLKSVGFRTSNGHNFQDLEITKLTKSTYNIAYSEYEEGKSIYKCMAVTREQLEELVQQIQHQLLGDL